MQLLAAGCSPYASTRMAIAMLLQLAAHHVFCLRLPCCPPAGLAAGCGGSRGARAASHRHRPNQGAQLLFSRLMPIVLACRAPSRPAWPRHAPSQSGMPVPHEILLFLLRSPPPPYPSRSCCLGGRWAALSPCMAPCSSSATWRVSPALPMFREQTCGMAWGVACAMWRMPQWHAHK